MTRIKNSGTASNGLRADLAAARKARRERKAAAETAAPVTSLSDAYRHLMSAAASAREAKDALEQAGAIDDHLSACQVVDTIDNLCVRVEAALKAGA